MSVTVEVPIKTPNMTNRREHYMARARRQKKQRDVVLLMLRAKNPAWKRVGPELGDLRIAVTLTRISPGMLDAHDNLRAALKSIADGVAEYLAMDDADPRIEWVYRQERGKPASVRLQFDVSTGGGA